MIIVENIFHTKNNFMEGANYFHQINLTDKKQCKELFQRSNIYNELLSSSSSSSSSSSLSSSLSLSSYTSKYFRKIDFYYFAEVILFSFIVLIFYINCAVLFFKFNWWD